VKLYSTAENGR